MHNMFPNPVDFKVVKASEFFQRDCFTPSFVTLPCFIIASCSFLFSSSHFKPSCDSDDSQAHAFNALLVTLNGYKCGEIPCYDPC